MADNLAQYKQTLSARAYALRTASSQSQFETRRAAFEQAMNQIGVAQATALQDSQEAYDAVTAVYQRTLGVYAQEIRKYESQQLSWQRPSRSSSSSSSRSSSSSSSSSGQSQSYTPPSEETIQSGGETPETNAILAVLWPAYEPWYKKPAVWFLAAGVVIAGGSVLSKTTKPKKKPKKK
jgi:hypothetical protein